MTAAEGPGASYWRAVHVAAELLQDPQEPELLNHLSLLATPGTMGLDHSSVAFLLRRVKRGLAGSSPWCGKLERAVIAAIVPV